MKHRIAAVSLLVRDSDEAIAWFTGTLEFSVLEDTDFGGGKRWVIVAPAGSTESRILLARAVSPSEISAVGNQSGGRVFLFLHTDDFARDFAAFKSRGVKFLEEPRYEAYGTVAVFEDLYGNRWDLIEPR